MEEESRVFRLRYVGARFKGAKLPVDVLPDLPAFRDLLVAYVKAGWRESHPDRERLPKGFARGLKFDLLGIEEGSAIPALKWDSTNAQLQLPEFRDEMEELVESAFQRFVRLIDASAFLTSDSRLNSEEVRALNRFGAGLEADERIELVGEHDSSGKIVYLDAFRRRQLLRQASDFYEVRFDSVGKLLGSRVDERELQGFVDISTDEYGALILPMSPDRVMEEFDGEIGSDVQFRLMIALDKSDNFVRVSDVLEIDVIADAQLVADLERCRGRIDSLRSLTAGWLNGVGEPLSTEAVNAAYRLLGSNPKFAKLYRIFPTDQGGILFEFILNGWDYSIEIRANGEAELIGIESNGPSETERGPYRVDSEEFRAVLEMLVAGERP